MHCNLNLRSLSPESFSVSISATSKGGPAQRISYAVLALVHSGACFWLPLSCETDTVLHFVKEESIYKPRIHFKPRCLTLTNTQTKPFCFVNLILYRRCRNSSKLTSINTAQKAVKTPPDLTHITVRHTRQLLDNRITECSGLEGTSVGHPVQPPAQAGSPRAGCTAPCPGGAGIFPEKETPQPPWAAWARAPSP